MEDSVTGGAIDGTVCPIARPEEDQQTAYNGHKHLHALKFQIIAMPDGLVFTLEPYDGHWNDLGMFHESRLVNWAKVHAKGVSGKQRYLYGDQAYGEPQSNGASVRYVFNGIDSETSSINGQV